MRGPRRGGDAAEVAAAAQDFGIRHSCAHSPDSTTAVGNALGSAAYIHSVLAEMIQPIEVLQSLPKVAIAGQAACL